MKQIRLALGVTQERFAESADLDPKYYQHFEAGRKPNPEMETVLKLAKACGLELTEFFDFSTDPVVLAEARDKEGLQATSRKAKRRAKTAGGD